MPVPSDARLRQKPVPSVRRTRLRVLIGFTVLLCENITSTPTLETYDNFTCSLTRSDTFRHGLPIGL